tara:strand:+ start:818 stop:1039 length:222 start_codon:yes stop_codon:yes gene_type:complete
MAHKNRATRRLHVRKVRDIAVSKAWKLPNYFTSDWVFVMCNKSGEFNWDTARVYNASELVERDNVHIVGEVIR